MLVRLDLGVSRRLFAEIEEAPNLITKIGESLIVNVRSSFYI